MIPALTTMALFVFRTKLEDELLLKKLTVYEEYALRTKYRLIPCVWGKTFHVNCLEVDKRKGVTS